jgi:hypothetical protein
VLQTRASRQHNPSTTRCTPATRASRWGARDGGHGHRWGLHHARIKSELDGLGVAGGRVTIDLAAARFQALSDGLELRIIWICCGQLNEHLRKEANKRLVAMGVVAMGGGEG